MAIVDSRAVDKRAAVVLVERLGRLAKKIVLKPTSNDSSPEPSYIVSCRPTDDPRSLTEIVSLADRAGLDVVLEGDAICFHQRQS